MIKSQTLGSLTSQASGQLDILLLDGNTLSVDGSQVGVLKEGNQVSLDGLLQGTDGRRLESQVGLEILCNFTHQSLEWQLSDQKLGGLLETSNLSKSNGTWFISVWLLDTTCGWSRLSGSLGSELLSWGLTTSGLSCCLFGSSHCCC